MEATWSDAGSRLAARAASYVKENRLPGAAVGVVDRNELGWWAPIGFADIASCRPPELTTLYRIASITKTFTATAIMRLRDEGRLRLDDPVARYIPDVAHLEDVTIRRILSHESGLQSEPPETDWAEVKYEGNVERNLERAKEMATVIPPNSQTKYSNLGFQLLGEVIARVSEMPYVDYIRERILEPVGMTSTSFEPLPPNMLPNRATGYAARFLSDNLALASIPPSIWSEGGLWSCVDDLARWISYQFSDDATLREMHRPRYITDADWTQAWCIGWYALRREKTIWIVHTGSLHGFSSAVCFRPADRIGAIALINGVGDAATLAIDLGTIALEALNAMGPRIELPPPLPEAFGDVIGFYVRKESDVVLRVEWRDGRLAVIDPGLPAWRPTLTPTSDRDVFMIEPGVRQSGERAVFRRLEDGRVSALFLAASTYERLDPVSAAVRMESDR
ncbi:MAG TPA: serine hydrolase domain-containing protein [Candidatus Dormibacteraeota bacterium]|nr:serine hydrolase domain-containing protein [Candidatus Dormibacteraeota bacterium]